MPRLALLALLLAALSLPASAQSVSRWAAPLSPPPGGSAMTPPTDPGGAPGTPAPPTQSVPLDGGLGLLALAGGAYAVRRLRQR